MKSTGFFSRHDHAMGARPSSAMARIGRERAGSRRARRSFGQHLFQVWLSPVVVQLNQCRPNSGHSPFVKSPGQDSTLRNPGGTCAASWLRGLSRVAKGNFATNLIIILGRYTGKNLPITPDQIKQGPRRQFSEPTGGQSRRLARYRKRSAARLLSDVIDKSTPSNKIEAVGIDQLLKMFQGKMGA